MVQWIRPRQLTVVIALVGVLLLGGATAVLAAQNYASPGATHTPARASEPTGTTTPRATPESTSEHDQDNDQNDDQDDNSTEQDGQTLSGVVQSVSIEAHSFVLLPDGKQETVTIAFDAKTDIEQEHGSSPLVAGAHVTVEVVKRADGSLYAAEIKGAQQGRDDQDQQTPTPGAGERD